MHDSSRGGLDRHSDNGGSKVTTETTPANSSLIESTRKRLSVVTWTREACRRRRRSIATTRTSRPSCSTSNSGTARTKRRAGGENHRRRIAVHLLGQPAGKLLSAACKTFGAAPG